MKVTINETDLDNLVGVSSELTVPKKGLKALVELGLVAENQTLTDLGRQIVKMHEEGDFHKDGTVDGVPYTFELKPPKAQTSEIELIVAVGALVKKLFKALGYGLVAYVIVSYFTIYRYWNASDPSDQLIIEYGADDIMYGQMLSAGIGFIVAGITLLRKPK
jgi:hypothetical protein